MTDAAGDSVRRYNKYFLAMDVFASFALIGFVLMAVSIYHLYGADYLGLFVGAVLFTASVVGWVFAGLAGAAYKARGL